MSQYKFYSMKFDRFDTIKRHKTKDAAIRNAGDFGMIFDVDEFKEYQVHLMSNCKLECHPETSWGHTPMTFKMSEAIRTQFPVSGKAWINISATNA